MSSPRQALRRSRASVYPRSYAPIARKPTMIMPSATPAISPIAKSSMGTPLSLSSPRRRTFRRPPEQAPCHGTVASLVVAVRLLMRSDRRPGSAWIRPRKPSRTWRNVARRSASGPSTASHASSHVVTTVSNGRPARVHALARPARALESDLVHDAHGLRAQAARLEARTRDLDAFRRERTEEALGHLGPRRVADAEEEDALLLRPRHRR